MDSRSHPKSDLYQLLGYLMLALILVFNPFTVSWWQDIGFFPKLSFKFMHSNDVKIAFPLLIDVFCLVTGILILRHPIHIKNLVNDSAKFNLFLLVFAVLILLTTNVIMPGWMRSMRVLWILGILFLMTNTLYMLVAKKRSRPIANVWKNIALVGYSLGLVLVVLEGVFMFFEKPHRFNGNLASRAWFMNNWELNAEGYRDVPMGEAGGGEDKRPKLMVLGDSFVAGHGVTDPEDRFSNRLQDKLSQDFRVYNLGVGGSDVADGYKRLLEFPEEPDVLVYSWYFNDIEHDGELGGLKIASASSYSDLVAPARYLVRRSYLLNYLYWQYPHPDEIFDFMGYVRECFSNPKVMGSHFQQLDSLRLYADAKGIPFACVVFPLLQDIAGSNFATDPIIGYFNRHQIPVLDVGQILKGYPTEELVVNENDGHPGPFTHKVVADSLYVLLQRNGMLNP